MPSTTIDNNQYRKGVILTLLCYIFWGFFPIYWYPLAGFDPLQLMAQRICWSLLFILLLLLFRKKDRALIKPALMNRKILITFIGTSFFLFLNWSTYLWAISSSHVLDASLGYYINPLVSVFLGRIFFKEELTKLQYLAISIAFLGVFWLAILGGSIPYIALILAFSFGIYGAIKKIASLPPLPGLFLETLFMMPFAIVYLLIEANNGHIEFLGLSTLQILVLVFSGAATTIPLLLFAEGAKRIPLSIVGILQYVSPTLQFFSGVFIFNESFTGNRLIGFALVWLAVALYIFSEINRIRRKRLTVITENSG